MGVGRIYRMLLVITLALIRSCSERVRAVFKKRRMLLAIGLLLSFALVLPGRAEDVYDHDRARQALEAGEILPLSTVLAAVARDTPGQVMEVELEQRGGRWFYEIKLLRPGGALMKLWVDARDGTVIDTHRRVERANGRPNGKPNDKPSEKPTH